jgi:hypothetical protein
MRRVCAIGLLVFIASSAKANASSIRSFQRGETIVLETQLKSDATITSAALVWRTFDNIDPKQKGMLSAFLCTASVVPNGSAITVSCKIPLDVADGVYYLDLLSIKTADAERVFGSGDDVMPTETKVKIKSGPMQVLPALKSVDVKMKDPREEKRP